MRNESLYRRHGPLRRLLPSSRIVSASPRRRQSWDLYRFTAQTHTHTHNIAHLPYDSGLPTKDYRSNTRTTHKIPHGTPGFLSRLFCPFLALPPPGPSVEQRDRPEPNVQTAYQLFFLRRRKRASIFDDSRLALAPASLDTHDGVAVVTTAAGPVCPCILSLSLSLPLSPSPYACLLLHPPPLRKRVIMSLLKPPLWSI